MSRHSDTNPLRVGMIELPLTKGYVTTIDEVDADLGASFKWSARVTRNRAGEIDSVYAIRGTERCGKQKQYYLHVTIMERVLGSAVPEDRYVDHIDRNSLNNSRTNLRLATFSQNVMNSGIPKSNTSGYKGVAFDKLNQRWMATINVEHTDIWLGRFDTALEAGIAYNQAAARLHGDYAALNDIPGWESVNLDRKDRRQSRKDNKSGYPNIHFISSINRWRAYVRRNGKTEFVGAFHSLEDARQAQLKAQEGMGALP
jgi:hypothetical protein